MPTFRFTVGEPGSPSSRVVLTYDRLTKRKSAIFRSALVEGCRMPEPEYRHESRAPKGRISRIRIPVRKLPTFSTNVVSVNANHNEQGGKTFPLIPTDFSRRNGDSIADSRLQRQARTVGCHVRHDFHYAPSYQTATWHSCRLAVRIIP